MKISIIAAVAQNNVIGKDNKLLWRLKKDMQWFKKHTSGHCVLMGRKTFDSLGKPLPNRKNIVITSKPSENSEDLIFFKNIEEGISYAKEHGETELFVIGGGEIYKQLLPKSETIYLTIVDCEPEGDTYFPVLDYNNYQIIFEEYHESDDENEYPFSFIIMNRC
jgi:dihydrofolate reductase